MNSVDETIFSVEFRRGVDEGTALRTAEELGLTVIENGCILFWDGSY